MKLKHLLTGIAAQTAGIAWMWNCTRLEVTGICFLSFFALGAGIALSQLLEPRKSQRHTRKHHEAKVYTYTRSGRCLEGYYRQVG